MFIRTIATQPDSTHQLAPYNNDRYWPDNAPTGIVCGDQPDGDGECTNEVLKGCICPQCQADADASAPEETTLCASKGCTVDVEEDGDLGAACYTDMILRQYD